MSEKSRSAERRAFRCRDGGLRARDVHNGRVLNAWCAAWAVCFLGATALVSFLEPPVPLALAIVAAPLASGVFALRAYLSFLREADELLRKIHLESLGAGAGAAMAVGTTFLMTIPLGASPLWGLTLALSALGVGYSLAVIRATRNLRA